MSSSVLGRAPEWLWFGGSESRTWRMVAGNMGEMEHRQDVGSYKHQTHMWEGETGLPVRCTQAERWGNLRKHHA